MNQFRYAAQVSSQLDAITIDRGTIDRGTIDRGTIIQRAMKERSLSVYPSQGSGAEVIFMNITRPPLDDVRVRGTLDTMFMGSALYVGRT